MKKLSSALLLFLSAAFFVLSAQEARANRAAAAEIAYKWVSDSTYLVTYTLYRDCAGSSEPATVRVCYYNTCNTDNGSVLLSKRAPLGSNGTIVDPGNGCSGAPTTTCTSPSSTVKGFRKWVYEGTITLPSKCATWKFAVSIDARNAGTTNYASFATNNNLYTEATLNNIDAPKGSSPTFATDLIQYVCAGIPQSINYGGVDPDGDALTYSLIDPQTALENQSACAFPPAPTSYAFGGTKPGTSLTTNPFPAGGSFDYGSGGVMNFTAAAASGAQQAIMTMLIVQRQGTKVVGTTMRDVQVIVNGACAANNVTFTTTSYTKAFLNTAKRVQICPNVAMSVCYRLSTPDATVTISNVTDNHLTFSPTSGTSTITPSGYAGVGTNAVSGCLNWTPNETDQGVKTFIIESDICRPGSPKVHRRDTIIFHIVETLNLVATDTFICFGDSSWICPKPDSSAQGDTYPFGITISNTGTFTGSVVGITKYPPSPCISVRPASTTVFLMTSDNIPGGCKRQDLPNLETNQAEMKIVVVNPKIDAGPDTVTCVYSSLQLNSNLLNPQPELTYQYRWSPGKYLSDSTVAAPVLSFPKGVDPSTLPDSLTYVLKVTPNPGGDCFRLDTIVVYLIKGYYILTGDTLQKNPTGLGYKLRQKGVSDTVICSGKSIILEGWRDISRGATNDSTYTYTWNPPTGVSTPTEFIPGVTSITPTDTGLLTYTLTASRAGCPDSVKKINIIVDKVPTVTVTPDREICFGDTIQIYADITPSPDVFSLYKYEWFPGGAIAKADTFVTYFTGYRTEKVNFRVTTLRAGCTATASAVYTVKPRAFLTVSPDTAICPGDSAALRVDGDALLKTITWKPLTNIDSIHSKRPMVAPTFTTDYVVIGTDSNSCVDSASVRVSVYPRTVIYLPDSARIYPGEIYELAPTGNALYYSWFPLTGFLEYRDSTAARVKIAPQINTTYKLHAVSAAGCVAEDSIYVFVTPDSYVDVPNAFAPGRSGENTTFKASRLGDVTLTSLKVYNRWGLLVYESSNIDEGWDGNYKGEPQPMGVYVYTIEAVTKAGKKVSKQGNVTLIR